MKKRVASLLLAAVLVLTACGSKEEQQNTGTAPEYVLTYAENQSAGYPTTEAAMWFANLVEQRTDGKIHIQVKYGGELGEEQAVVGQVQFGGIDFARVSLASVADDIPELQVLQMPFLYNDSEHMWKVLDGEIGESYLKAFNGSGAMALSWYDAGARSFYSSQKAIRSLEDLSGMAIRVQDSELMCDMIRAMGATPFKSAFDSVYSDLETGQIDAAENNYPSYESMKHYEVAGYFTLDEHTRVPEVQIVSEQTWGKLSKEYQDIIRECARESSKYERKLWNEREEYAREKLLDKGIEEIHLSQAEKEKFRESVQAVYEKYCSGEMDTIEKIRKMD